MARDRGDTRRTRFGHAARGALAALGDRARSHPHRLLAAALALLGGVAVLAVSLGVFPYHSPNHDEGVYLQQAAMLLEGQLTLRPPFPDAMRPWFFVRDGATTYPKYAPVPAAVFALGEALVGSFRAALPAVAAANVALCYAVVAEAFDRRTGLLAAALLVASPLFLLNSAVFLPYAPTTMLNLGFALAYLRAARRAGRADGGATAGRLDRRTLALAAVAGTSAGLAFFARPYTAVLFAAPFLVHAGWQLWASRLARPVLVRHGATAALGLCGVAAALAYNAAMTGSALTFPYEAFAPLDGLGFGHREILGYERDYTPALGLRASAEVLWRLFTEWVVAGPLGTALAAVGLVAAALGAWRRGLVDPSHSTALTDRQVQALLAGLFVTVAAGNVAFWGNLNVLGSLADPDDGLLSLLGPYYHFDLLVPTAAFAAHGVVVLGRRFRAFCRRFPRERARAALLAGLLVGGTVFGGAAVAVAADPVGENTAIAERYEQAYAPFEDRPLDDAVVFLPDPYGDWLNHPFQALRNDPGFDGPAVYALDEGAGNFEVVDAYPDRELYRYAYRGQWAPTAGATVDARLQPVEAVAGQRLTLAADLGVPAGIQSVTVRLSAGGDAAYYTVADPGGNATLRLTLADGRASLDGPGVEPTDGNATVVLDGDDEVAVEAFLDARGGVGFSYRLDLPVERGDKGVVRAMTPTVEVCRSPDRCGGEAAYVPGVARPGVSVDVALNATGESA